MSGRREPLQALEQERDRVRKALETLPRAPNRQKAGFKAAAPWMEVGALG